MLVDEEPLILGSMPQEVCESPVATKNGEIFVFKIFAILFLVNFDLSTLELAAFDLKFGFCTKFRRYRQVPRSVESS